MGRSTEEGVDICISARLSLKHVVIEAAVQRAFRRHFDIPPRSRDPPDLKCVLIDKRISWTSVRRDRSVAGVSVSSKTIRSRFADVRLKGRIPRKETHLNLQQWVYFKFLVYKDRSNTPEDLPNNISVEMDNIHVHMLEKGAQSFRNRLQKCINNVHCV
ncbi:hypothetical protein TNCV_4108511 [Trichonephila clavipes]|nr:hypothetical protein TNCV_4108511 [Trichonephila clavipes]